jgi:hypothetical protein
MRRTAHAAPLLFEVRRFSACAIHSAQEALMPSIRFHALGAGIAAAVSALASGPAAARGTFGVFIAPGPPVYYAPPPLPPLPPPVYFAPPPPPPPAYYGPPPYRYYPPPAYYGPPVPRWYHAPPPAYRYWPY